MAQPGSAPAKRAEAKQEAAPKPGKQALEHRPRKQRAFVVARSVDGHEVVNTLDLSPHFEFSF